MSGYLKKVRAGDRLRIPAETYNAFIDTARDYQQRQRDLEQQAKPTLSSSGLVLVKNASGQDRERFDVLGVDAPIFSPTDNLESFKNKLAVKGITPTTSHAGRFIILQEPLKANAIGLGAASGLSVVKLNVQAESDLMADVADAQAGSLKTGSSGAAQILWKETGTGLKWGLVRIGAGGGGAQLLVSNNGITLIDPSNGQPVKVVQINIPASTADVLEFIAAGNGMVSLQMKNPGTGKGWYIPIWLESFGKWVLHLPRYKGV